MDERYWYLVCWETYLAVWKFFKRHSKESPVDWEGVYQDAYAVRERHPTRLCERLLSVMVEALEQKENKRGGDRCSIEQRNRS